MSEKKQKIGAGHAKAMMRQGAKEIAQVLPAFPAHGVQPIEEPGLAGNLTHRRRLPRDKGRYESMLGRFSSRDDQEQTQNRDLER